MRGLRDFAQKLGVIVGQQQYKQHSETFPDILGFTISDPDKVIKLFNTDGSPTTQIKVIY